MDVSGWLDLFKVRLKQPDGMCVCKRSDIWGCSILPALSDPAINTGSMSINSIKLCVPFAIHDHSHGPPGFHAFSNLIPAINAVVGGMRKSRIAIAISARLMSVAVSLLRLMKPCHWSFLLGSSWNFGVQARGTSTGRTVFRRSKVAWIGLPQEKGTHV